VLFAGNPSGSQYTDIASESFGDELQTEEFVSASSLRVGHFSKLSITYNVANVHDQEAAEFLHKLKSLLDNPELLLL